MISALTSLALAPSNKRVQPTGWIGVILASRSSKKAVPIYRRRFFQPAADAQAVGRHSRRVSSSQVARKMLYCAVTNQRFWFRGRGA